MCQQPNHVLSLCPLNLIILPSYLSNQEGRCYSSPGVRSTCQFSSSYRSSQDDSPYCNMHTCSFLLCSSSSGSSSWSLGDPLETCSCLSFSQVVFRFFLAFWIHPWISSNQILAFARFDGSHHHQFILLLSEGFHELNKLRHIPGSSCQFSLIEGRKNSE